MEIPKDKRKGEHYNLRWHSYASNLIQVLIDHQCHENLVDVTLCCEGQFIKAHKLVLSACSEVFQEMFKVHTAQHPVIVLNGIKFNTFKHILQFMYRGEVQVSDTELEHVLTLGENLQVKGLSSVKYKLQMAEELKTTDNLNSRESTPSSVSSFPTLNNQNIVSPSTIQQSKPKNVQTKKELTEKVPFPSNYGYPKSHVDGAQSGVKKVHAPHVNIQPESNQNVSKLESILTDPNESSPRKKFKQQEVYSSSASNGSNTMERRNSEETEKNLRPANAFMIFANEWRKKLAVEHPEENNKEISVRLGNMWKSLSSETKQSYYLAAKKIESEPTESNTDCSEKQTAVESKKRKVIRRKTVDSISHLVSVDLQECDDDDDLQIIEVNDDPITIPHPSAKRDQFNRKTNNT